MRIQERFQSRFGFLMAATGFAIGLGNIWRFPYVTGENGGAAFVLIYLGCALLIALPILIAEIAIGRNGRDVPPQAMESIASLSLGSRHWRHVGHWNLVTAFLIMGTYSVIAGWVLSYLFEVTFSGFGSAALDSASERFGLIQSDISGMVTWTGVALLITGIIISAGVEKGIERSVAVLMPMLFFLMVGLVIYNAIAGGFLEALNYLFAPDFGKVSGATFLAAVGQAFFSVGVAMAGMMIFGSYLPESLSIVKCSILVLLADTCISLLAGLMIFPMVFRFDLDPAGGVGLIFQVLPVAFAQLPIGRLLGSVFFLLLSVAAITSMVGFVEPLVAWFSQKFNKSRLLSTWTVMVAISLVSMISILSYTLIADWQLAGMDFNGIVDFVSNQIMLPIGGLLLAVFAAWVMSPEMIRSELGLQGSGWFKVWHNLIRFAVPLAIGAILITGLFDFS